MYIIPSFSFKTSCSFSHMQNTVGQAQRMKSKLKYASMWQYINSCDTAPYSHLQINLRRFPFEERLQ